VGLSGGAPPRGEAEAEQAEPERAEAAGFRHADIVVDDDADLGRIESVRPQVVDPEEQPLVGGDGDVEVERGDGRQDRRPAEQRAYRLVVVRRVEIGRRELDEVDVAVGGAGRRRAGDLGANAAGVGRTVEVGPVAVPEEAADVDGRRARRPPADDDVGFEVRRRIGEIERAGVQQARIRVAVNAGADDELERIRGRIVVTDAAGERRRLAEQRISAVAVARIGVKVPPGIACAVAGLRAGRCQLLGEVPHGGLGRRAAGQCGCRRDERYG
jgi:hypothetical protein